MYIEATLSLLALKAHESIHKVLGATDYALSPTYRRRVAAKATRPQYPLNRPCASSLSVTSLRDHFVLHLHEVASPAMALRDAPLFDPLISAIPCSRRPGPP